MASASDRDGRDYPQALKLLESLQSNRVVVGSISDSKRDMNLDALPEMIDWTRKAGYEVQDLHKHGLRFIHIAGTKGKGSVCAMTENILLQYSSASEKQGVGKIGLYTSPHLIDVRERIRIDGAPISETKFSKYFFQLWDSFSRAAGQASKDDQLYADGKPGFFRFLTILAFHAFIREGVKTAILECGIGGEYDSTNIIPRETVTVTAITRLGIDHVGMLGDTIEKIAWHKSGIMKTDVPSFTVSQVTEAQEVLEDRALEKKVHLSTVARLPLIESGDIVLGLGGDFQVDNASLAVAVAASHLKTLGITSDNLSSVSDTPEALPEKFVQGLKTVLWPGRCQIINDGNIQWHIDGAHTTDSIIAAADWFGNSYNTAKLSSHPPKEMMLIFNQQDRDANKLVTTLISRICVAKDNFAGSVFRYAAFCTNQPFRDTEKGALSQDLRLQERTAKAYTAIDRNQLTMTYQSIEEAVELARKVAHGHERFMVLVTGSLYLVGGLLKVLEKQRLDQSYPST